MLGACLLHMTRVMPGPGLFPRAMFGFKILLYLESVLMPMTHVATMAMGYPESGLSPVTILVFEGCAAVARIMSI